MAKRKLDSENENPPAPASPPEGTSDAPKKRGRPPGTKNKPKEAIAPPLPPELLTMLARAPILTAAAVASLWDVPLAVTPEEEDTCAAALGAWIATLDTDLPPGLVVVLVYAMVLGNGVSRGLGERERRRAQRSFEFHDEKVA